MSKGDTDPIYEKKLPFEDEIGKLSDSEAPKILTKELPGPESKKILDQLYKLETPTIVGANVLPVVWARARGATVEDLDGNKYIDMMGGVAVNNVGHSHPEVVRAMHEQAGQVAHTADFPSPARIRLLEKLTQIAPGDMKGQSRVAFAMSGSDAVETALKIAKYHTKRTEIVAFQGAYHGVTAGALALTTNRVYKRGLPPSIPGVHFAPYPYCYRCPFGKKFPDCDLECARYTGDLMTKSGMGLADRPAAVIMEPVQGEGGYVVPPKEAVEWIAKVARENDIVFIDDEVQAGFCRTGRWFATEHYGVTPDLLTAGKGLGGDFPVAAVIGHKKIMDNLPTVWNPVTFGGNAVGAAVSLKNIELMERYDLCARSEVLGGYFMKLLKELESTSKIVGDVRGLGLMIGIELVKDKTTKAPMDMDKMMWLIHKMRDNGVLVLIAGRNENVVRLMPPLVITKEHIDKTFTIFSSILKELERSI